MLTVEQLESRDCPSAILFDRPAFSLEGGRLATLQSLDATLRANGAAILASLYQMRQ